MKTKYFLVLSFFIGMISCSEKKSTTSNAGEVDLESALKNAESRRKADPSASGNNKCLLEYQTKYDQLLTENEVIAATGFAKDIMEIKSSTTLNNPEYHRFEYKFKNGRTRYLPMIKQNIPTPDVIGIQSIKAISLSAFESTYKAISDEEMQAAKDVLNDATEGKSGDAEADAAVKKAEKLNVSKKQVKEIGSEIMNAMKEVSKGYRVVDHLGDAARWNIISNELYVLQNGVQFVILSEINNDNEKNKAVAIDLAKQILEKCK